MDWTYTSDSLQAFQYYNAGFLPETYDASTGRNLSILDQSDFFHKAVSIVERVKNKAEAKAMEDAKRASPKKGK